MLSSTQRHPSTPPLRAQSPNDFEEHPEDCARSSINEACDLPGGISRNTIYKLMKSGELPSVVFGTRRSSRRSPSCTQSPAPALRSTP